MPLFRAFWFDKILSVYHAVYLHVANCLIHGYAAATVVCVSSNFARYHLGLASMILDLDPIHDNR